VEQASAPRPGPENGSSWIWIPLVELIFFVKTGQEARDEPSIPSTNTELKLTEAPAPHHREAPHRRRHLRRGSGSECSQCWRSSTPNDN
jgi:hypothetical protein